MPVARTPLVVARLSRAAIFAGATLAGCVVTPATQQPPPPPPPPDDTQQHTPVDHVVEVPPPPPPPDGGFAKPPDGGFAKPPVTSGGISGVVVGSTTGRPMSGMQVHAQRAGEQPQTTQTDAQGRYAFHGLPAGTYLVTIESLRPNNPRQSPPPPTRGKVEVADGANARLDLTVVLYTEPVDRGPCCKPYGAPPARRRFV